MKKMALAALLGVVLCGSGCGIVARGGEDFVFRAWKHVELHILKFYKQFVKMHEEVDRYVFDLDWEDPDNY